MKPTLRILGAAVVLALAGCSQIGAAEPGPARPFGPGHAYGGWGSYGPGYGAGYGMMGPNGPGYGMTGPGMMMGPGMMGGWHGLPADLSPEQRAKIAEIQREQRSRQWPLMQQMHEAMWADGAADSAALDEPAQRRHFERIAALQKQMFENMLESRKRIEAVLTAQQRDELRRGGRPLR